MRCLNCNTVVADSDPCCLSCGARCTTPVSKQDSGKPIPFVALVLLAVGWVAGYADAFNSGESKKLAIHDRKAGKERMFEANLWGLGGLFLGLPFDYLVFPPPQEFCWATTITLLSGACTAIQSKSGATCAGQQA